MFKTISQGDMDALCVVCLEGHSVDGNHVLFCDGCNVPVHQKCYGVETIPEGDWFCDSCQDLFDTYTFVSSRDKQSAIRKTFRSCTFCPKSTLKTAFHKTSSGDWVHTMCSFYNKRVTMDKVTRLLNIDNVEKESGNNVCELCGQAGFLGCIKCEGVDCGRDSYFHVSCALLLGAKRSYSASMCPICTEKVRIEQQLKSFKRMLVGKENTEKILDGFSKYGRSGFAATVAQMVVLKSVNDQRTFAILQRLSSYEPHGNQDRLKFLHHFNRMRGGKKLSAKLLKSLRDIMSEDQEAKLTEQLSTLDCDILMGYSAEDLPFCLRDFCDSPELLVDIVMLGKDLVEAGVGDECVKTVVRDATRKVEELKTCEIKRWLEYRNLQTQLGEQTKVVLPFCGDSEAVEEPKKKGPGRGRGRRRSVDYEEKGVSNDSGPVDLQARQDMEDDRFGEVMEQPVPPSSKDYTIFRSIGQQLEKNALSEPYFQGNWNKAPYPKRPYERLTGYVPTPGLSEEAQAGLLRILNTTKSPECSLGKEGQCGDPAPYSISLGTFDTDLRCKSRRVACPVSAQGRDKPLELGDQVVEADMWGLDCYTRKNIQSIIEGVCSGTSVNIQRTLIQRLIMPVIDSQPGHRAHNITFALKSILRVIGVLKPELKEPKPGPKPEVKSEPTSDTKMEAQRKDPQETTATNVEDYLQEDDPHVSSMIEKIVQRVLVNDEINEEMIHKTVTALLFSVRTWGLKAFRIHPKGVGVQCRKPEGLPAGTFVTKYLGELFPPWRWFEKQDAIKSVQKKLRFKPVLPDFYNIMLERHDDDEQGYDCAYIDPIVRGNFASRLSHSCEPNCATVVMVQDGKYVVTVYTLREIGFGEELTFDYSSVTEDENEFKAATCLCGSINCRGSFLYYAGLGAFAQVINECHTFIHRNALVYKACLDPVLQQSDVERLHRHGVKDAALGGLPQWCKKWTSLVLEYGEFEAKELSHRLCLVKHKITGRLLYNEESARLEARGVLENRKQNVVITLNKIRNFCSAARPIGVKGKMVHCVPLPKELDQIPSPLRPLSEIEVVNMLWNDNESPFAISLQKACDAVSSDTLFALREKQKQGGIETLGQLRRVMHDVRDAFWSLKPTGNSLFHAAGDVVTWLMNTHHFFTSVQYPGYRSALLQIRNVDIGRDGSVFGSIKGSDGANSGPQTKKYKIRLKRTKVGENCWQAVPESTTKENGRWEISERTPGPMVLPYWIVSPPDEYTSAITLTACKKDDFALLTCIQGPNEHSFVHSVEISLKSSEPAVAMKIDSSSSSQLRFRVSTNPMPGLTPFYIFQPRPTEKCSPPFDQNQRGTVVLTRIVPDAPYRPENIDGVAWYCTGLFYAFDVEIPGTTRITVVDASGKLLNIFAFEDEFFHDKISFENDQNTFAASPSRKTASGSRKRIKQGIDPLKVVHEEQKKYQSGFVWGQMSGWFKQTVAAPDASLSAERRGTLSMPDLMSCFGKSNKYKDRKDIIERIRKHPDCMWPTGTHWSFRNKIKLYGSPWFDAAVDPMLKVNVDTVVSDMNYHMKHGVPPPRSET